MSIFGFSSILLTPYTSSLIDKYGKKLLSLIALCMMIISSISFVFIENYYLILFSRILQGVSFSIFFNSSSAIASNNLDDKDKQVGLSFFSSFTILSYFLGPYFSEKIIINFGFTEFFIYASFFSLIAFILILFVNDEVDYSHTTIDTSSFFKVIKENNIFNYLFANFLLASGFGVVMNFLSLFLKGKELSVGFFFIAYSVVVSLSRIFLSSRFASDKLYNKILIMLTFFSISIFFLPFVDTKFHVIIFSIIFSLTYSLVYPFLSSITLSGKSKSLSGRLFGALNSSFSIGVNLMTFFYGFIAEICGFNIMFKCASILIFTGVLFLIIKDRRLV